MARVNTDGVLGFLGPQQCCHLHPISFQQESGNYCPQLPLSAISSTPCWTLPRPPTPHGPHLFQLHLPSLVLNFLQRNQKRRRWKVLTPSPFLISHPSRKLLPRSAAQAEGWETPLGKPTSPRTRTGRLCQLAIAEPLAPQPAPGSRATTHPTHRLPGASVSCL